MTVRSIITVLLLSLGLSLPAHADQIEPQTLWELTQEARLIVLAEVEVGNADPHSPDYSAGIDVAQLRVLEVWKGTRPERLDVVIRRTLCPTPPWYEPGRRVVAFLKPSGSSWRTTGLSYGARYPTDEAAEQAYRLAVSMALEAQESGREKQRVEWAVNTAVHPATRWDGLYALVPAFDADARPRQDVSGQRNAGRLSLRQQQLLADAFVKAPVSEGTLSRILALLEDYPSKAVDDTALSFIEMSLRDSEGLQFDTERAMKLIARRLGKPLASPEPPKPQRAAARKEDEDPPYETHEAILARLKQQWESFKKENHLTPAPLSSPHP
jgi:hypothetical protein